MSATAGTAPEATLSRGAQVFKIPPPLYYGAAFAAGMVLHAVTVPLAIGARPETAVLGIVGLAAGALLALAGVRDVVRHHTTIVPHHAVSTLVTTGAYRFSRNPMYAGLAIAYVGGALLAGTWWPLVTLPSAVLAVRRVVIDPEERYLTARFGQVYAGYRARVRRWL
jgi:protein-S-isoprenylcysteine O-methyltransferase Ste14